MACKEQTAHPKRVCLGQGTTGIPIVCGAPRVRILTLDEFYDAYCDLEQHNRKLPSKESVRTNQYLSYLRRLAGTGRVSLSDLYQMGTLREGELEAEEEREIRRRQRLEHLRRYLAHNPFPTFEQYRQQPKQYDLFARISERACSDWACEQAYMEFMAFAVRHRLLDQLEAERRSVSRGSRIFTYQPSPAVSGGYRISFDEFFKTFRDPHTKRPSPAKYRKVHEQVVFDAMVVGEDIPPHVIAEYPHLSSLNEYIHSADSKTELINHRTVEAKLQRGEVVPVEILSRFPDLLAEYGA